MCLCPDFFSKKGVKLMRNLTTRDIFAMSRIVTKMGIKEELRRLADTSTSQNKLDIGIDIFMALITKASTEEAEHEIYTFLGGVLDMTPEAVGDLDPNELVENFTGPKGEQWKDFFMKVLKLIQR